jgi:parvulin-like peptidyl-prolyl isomerase
VETSDVNIRLLAIVSTSLVLSGLVGCGRTTGPEELASFDGGVVEADELDALMVSLPDTRRQPPAGQTVGQWLEEMVLDAALEETLLARAVEEGLGDDPVLRLQALNLASRQLGSSYAQRQCPAEEVSEVDIDEAYKTRVARGDREWILLRHIFKRVSDSAPAARRSAARADLEALRDQIQDGASFADLAREHSDSETAAEGGLIGRVSRGAPMEAAVLEAAWALADGETSGIIEVPNGFHIVRREDSGVDRPPDLEETRERLRLQLVQERRELCGQQLLTRLARESGVMIDQGAALTPAGDAVVLSVGERSFTASQLRGLGEDLRPIAELPDLPNLLRSFAEALLLAGAAQAEDPSAQKRYEELEAGALEHLLLARQWRSERHRFVAAMPEQELEAYYREHEGRFAADAVIDTSVLVVYGTHPGEDRAVQARAWAARERIDRGEPFADVAAEVSAHSSRDQGGRLGLMTVPKLRNMLGAEGYRAVSGLEPGEVSSPFRVTGPPAPSWALVKVHEHDPPRPRSFDEVRDEVIEAIAGERVHALDREIREQIRDEIQFRVNRRAMAQYVQGLGAGEG